LLEKPGSLTHRQRRLTAVKGGAMKFVEMAVIAGLIALWTPESAKAFTGADLYRICAGKGRGANETSCKAYTRGFVDGMTMGAATGKTAAKFCPPKGGISDEQSRLVIERYLKDHPEDLRDDAGLMAGVALLQAFPCPASAN
jgi:hypothetical protein